MIGRDKIAKTKQGEPQVWLEAYIRSLEFGEFTDDCVLWPFARISAGYPTVTIGDRTVLVTRYVWERFSGQTLTSPKELIRHSCDNPPCINLCHLATGTNTDNMRDMRERSRQCRGEQKPGVKLTARDVQLIRASLASGYGVRQISREFSVSVSVISDIHTYKSWTHV